MSCEQRGADLRELRGARRRAVQRGRAILREVRERLRVAGHGAEVAREIEGHRVDSFTEVAHEAHRLERGLAQGTE